MLILVSVRLIKVKKAPQDSYTVRIGQYAFEIRMTTFIRSEVLKKQKVQKNFVMFSDHKKQS